MTIAVIATMLVVAGSCMFGYLYHIRPRGHASDADKTRAAIASWSWYRYVDWYLKVSTPAVTLTAIWTEEPWLLTWHDNSIWLFAGLAGAGLALLLLAAAMWALDAQYTPAHASRLPLVIVTSGPYRYIRHPVYTSNLLLTFALFVASGSFWILFNLAVLFVCYVPTILREESAIVAEFPEYQHYIDRTGRFFPRIRRIRGGDE